MKVEALLQVSHSGFLRCMLGSYAHTGSSSVQNDLKRYFGAVLLRYPWNHLQICFRAWICE